MIFTGRYLTIKKFVSLFLVLVLCLSLAPAAMAASGSDKVFTENAAISSSQRDPEKWRNMTVKSGAAVTMTASSYLEIRGSLTVEAGGSLTGGQIWFFRQSPASVSGLPLWYETTGGDLPFPAEVALNDLWELTRGPVIVFKYKPSTGHYVYAESTHDSVFQGDLFNGGGKNEGDQTFSTGARIVWPATYHSMTVSSGAAVRIIDGTRITVEQALTVAPGASLTGGRLNFCRGASVSGLTLYYQVSGAEQPLAGGLEPFFQVLGMDYAEFSYRADTGHYTLGQEFGGDPFDPHQPGGGNPSSDQRAPAFAEQLKTLGLFKGVGANPDGSTNFDLDRTPTRSEAIVLLIRLLGKDANGGDFTWDAPEKLAMSLGLIGGEGDLQNFNRGTCVRMMEAALRNATKDGTKLADKLIEQGVFTQEAYEAAFRG